MLVPALMILRTGRAALAQHVHKPAEDNYYGSCNNQTAAECRVHGRWLVGTSDGKLVQVMGLRERASRVVAGG